MPEKGCYICLPDEPTEGLEDPCDACEASWMEYVYALCDERTDGAQIERGDKQ